MKESFPPVPPFRELYLGKDKVIRLGPVCVAHQTKAEAFSLSS